MKNVLFILMSLLIFGLSYLIVALLTFMVSDMFAPTPTTTNPILTFAPYLTSATWTAFLAPFSLIISYPLSFRLGRFLMAKRGWVLANLTTLLYITLFIYLTPSFVLLLLHFVS
ncbi:hypothetical protein CO180_03405 [candidate division WWE3 bacterium CG_4_9_14_3_um_filter_41_6]|uniref:Uncharacterized protein n=1 Tax=candidate division WWE3 bacterium CG_4_10_14_0_2_um_filter_41_14 TaxID=1975072 RepID=A0A2M7TIH7_UNCKA|nr:MAG: hypothetical protein COY32_03810 [candidate division WWE3 bacterium CG_4_10_14_0_2_um_filter_41_14]PJA38506.1 MAG: hypothetical protein CO180_03405 [candidate division WWE3 bacterium CG_4_9_14_3_um_filter_41_6]